MQKNIFVSLLVVIFSSGFFIPTDGYSFSFFSRYTSVKENNGEIRLGVDEVADGQAHYYSFERGEKTINFFIIKSPDGVIRAAFDACDVCFPSRKGYIQEGEYMVCKNCGRKFHTNRVNVVEGGCNPAPLKRRTDGNQLVIGVTDLLSGSRFF